MVEHEQVAIAVDYGQQVIKIVRDTAGQLADHLHFVPLLQARLEFLFLGNVLGDEVETKDNAIVPAPRPATEPHLNLAPIAPQPGAFEALHGSPATRHF